VVAALVEQGWQVVNFDRVPSPHSNVSFIRTDFTDFGQVVEAFSGIDEVHPGVDAVVHLAAIPGATFAPNVATFDNNLRSGKEIAQLRSHCGDHNAGESADDGERSGVPRYVLSVLRSAAGVSVWYTDCGVDLRECGMAVRATVGLVVHDGGINGA
jgi:hypothetical protein